MSPLKKRLPGILAAGLVALAVGAAGAPASAAGVSSSDASVSGLTSKQQKAKTKELKKCDKKKGKNKAQTKKMRKKCKDSVNKKYKKIAQNNVPKGATKLVTLGDNYFAPGVVDLKVNDSINWSWSAVAGYEAHNVTLATGPSGVSRTDFVSQTTADNNYSFKRTFVKPGGYDFVCSLHTLMTMRVNVTN
ncbi:MAG: cupredoxin domain-containing protein [Solirubrobacterales bacterium]